MAIKQSEASIRRTIRNNKIRSIYRSHIGSMTQGAIFTKYVEKIASERIWRQIVKEEKNENS